MRDRKQHRQVSLVSFLPSDIELATIKSFGFPNLKTFIYLLKSSGTPFAKPCPPNPYSGNAALTSTRLNPHFGFFRKKEKILVFYYKSDGRGVFLDYREMVVEGGG